MIYLSLIRNNILILNFTHVGLYAHKLCYLNNGYILLNGTLTPCLQKICTGGSLAFRLVQSNIRRFYKQSFIGPLFPIQNRPMHYINFNDSNKN